MPLVDIQGKRFSLKTCRFLRSSETIRVLPYQLFNSAEGKDIVQTTTDVVLSGSRK